MIFKTVYFNTFTAYSSSFVVVPYRSNYIFRDSVMSSFKAFYVCDLNASLSVFSILWPNNSIYSHRIFKG